MKTLKVLAMSNPKKYATWEIRAQSKSIVKHVMFIMAYPKDQSVSDWSKTVSDILADIKGNMYVGKKKKPLKKDKLFRLMADQCSDEREFKALLQIVANKKDLKVADLIKNLTFNLAAIHNVLDELTNRLIEEDGDISKESAHDVIESLNYKA